VAHLRSIRLRGFKTFAKPTALSFEPGVTVIIGPNGSGKSNIADAVLWVLGEQSPGNLRGRSMQDVIFSGPDTRRSSASAEVSLVFDNQCGSFPVDAVEVEITRRLERDGGSDYRINGGGCRLLDVQDLVGGLGLGREMHSVISQGKVEALLNSTPETRRAMVEEAAGLGRFKKRRERSQAKLERTQQNLLRIGDIEREVKAALRPLRRQAEAAELFAEATENWALAKARLLLHASLEADRSRAEIDRELGGLQARRTAIEAELEGLRRQRAEEEEHFTASLRTREELNAQYHRARAAAEYLEGRAASLRQRLTRVEGETDRARRRHDLADIEVASLAARIEEMAVGVADQTRLDRVGEMGRVLRTALDETLPAYRTAGGEEDDLKDQVFELETERSRAAQDREFLRREIEARRRLNVELAVLLEEAQLRTKQLQGEAVRLETELAAVQGAVDKAGAGLKKAIADREAARACAGESSRREAAFAEALAGIESRQAVLADLLARREGAPAGARELVAGGQGGRPLTDVLTVEPGYERALAACLGPVIHAIVLSGPYDLTRVFKGSGALEVVWEGQTSGGEEPRTAPPDGTRDIWEMVSGPTAVMGSVRALVPPTAVVIDQRELKDGGWGGDQGGWRIVSRSGELSQWGLHAARRQELAAETLLKARNELEAAAEERRELLARRSENRGAAEEAAAEVARTEEAFHRAEELLHEAERRSAAGKNDRDLCGRRLDELQAQVCELQVRGEREAGLTEEMSGELRKVEGTMAAKEAQLEGARAALRALQIRLEAMRKTVGRLEEKKGQAVLVEVKLRERCRAHENERGRVLAQRAASAVEVLRCRRRVDCLRAYAPVLAETLSLAERLAVRARTAAAALEASVEEARVGTEMAAHVMRDRGSVETGLQSEHDAMAARLTELQVELARLDDRRSSLRDDLNGLRHRHLSPRGVMPADVAGEDAGSLAAAVERAERRRERIGPINPLAEQECAEMEERARFLAEQRRDLGASLSQLQDVIRELDDHINGAFAEVFEAIRENFSAVIATVFPGSKGTLKLTEGRPEAGKAAAGEEGGPEYSPDEERVPSRGIALEVKFPNKSPRSLSLLSGGEKAMTAIAFLFSLFLARPCPFYVLDEVEASLDDINIRRFLSLVRKYQSKTQFIIITHQRQTMEVADTLYGVALESDGTSRILSRRLALAKGA